MPEHDKTATASPRINHYPRHYLNGYTTKYRYPQQYATTPPYRHHYRYYRDAATYEPYVESSYYYRPYITDHACRVLAWFEVPALVLMICLAITTAVSACLLRAIEKEMPQIEPLPAGKMVVLASPDTAQMSPAPTTEVVRVAMGEGNSTTDQTTDVKTEQNV